MLREEVEVVARVTHAFYFGTWDLWSHWGSNMDTSLPTEMVYGKRPTGKRMIKILRYRQTVR